MQLKTVEKSKQNGEAKSQDLTLDAITKYVKKQIKQNKMDLDLNEIADYNTKQNIDIEKNVEKSFEEFQKAQQMPKYKKESYFYSEKQFVTKNSHSQSELFSVDFSSKLRQRFQEKQFKKYQFEQKTSRISKGLRNKIVQLKASEVSLQLLAIYEQLSILDVQLNRKISKVKNICNLKLNQVLTIQNYSSVLLKNFKNIETQNKALLSEIANLNGTKAQTNKLSSTASKQQNSLRNKICAFEAQKRKLILQITDNQEEIIEGSKQSSKQLMQFWEQKFQIMYLILQKQTLKGHQNCYQTKQQIIFKDCPQKNQKLWTQTELTQSQVFLQKLLWNCYWVHNNQNSEHEQLISAGIQNLIGLWFYCKVKTNFSIESFQNKAIDAFLNPQSYQYHTFEYKQIEKLQHQIVNFEDSHRQPYTLNKKQLYQFVKGNSYLSIKTKTVFSFDKLVLLGTLFLKKQQLQLIH